MAGEQQPTGYRIVSPRSADYHPRILGQRETAPHLATRPFGHHVILDETTLQLAVQDERIHPEEARKRLAYSVDAVRRTLQSYFDEIHDYPEIARGIDHLWEEALADPATHQRMHFENSFMRTSEYPYYQQAYARGEFGSSHLLDRDVVDDDTFLAILHLHHSNFTERRRSFEERADELREQYIVRMTQFAHDHIAAFDETYAREKLERLHVQYVDEIPAAGILTNGFRTSRISLVANPDASAAERIQTFQLASTLQREFHISSHQGEHATITGVGGFQPDREAVLISAQPNPEDENRALFTEFAQALAGRRAKEIGLVRDGEVAGDTRVIHDRLGLHHQSRDGELTYFSWMGEATNALLVHRLLGTQPSQEEYGVQLLLKVMAPLQSLGVTQDLLFNAYFTDSHVPGENGHNLAWTQLNRALNQVYGPGFLGRLDSEVRYNEPYGVNKVFDVEWAKRLLKRTPRRRIVL